MRLDKRYIPPIMVEHARNRFGHKYFLVGLVIGLTPYLVHIKIWA